MINNTLLMTAIVGIGGYMLYKHAGSEFLKLLGGTAAATVVLRQIPVVNQAV